MNDYRQNQKAPGKEGSRWANPWLPRWFRVAQIRRETPDVKTLELYPSQGRAGLPFQPGQFCMLYVPGVGEVPISISGDSAHPEKLTHTIRAVGSVTRALCSLQVGDRVGVRGPFGRPWPIEHLWDRDVCIVAGGIGLAPLRPVIYFALQNRRRLGRLSLLYGARTPSDLLYRRELQRWRMRFDMDVFLTVDFATGDWRGNVGVVTRLISLARFDPDQTVALVCGPEAMMRHTVYALQEKGIGDEQIYLSLERNMKCAMAFCGHCQLGPRFICRDGPVFSYAEIGPLLKVRAL